METQFYFDLLTSLCHILMHYENIHFNLEHSSKTSKSELIIYFDFDEDALIKTIKDFVTMNYPYFQTTLIVFKDENTFKVLKVSLK